MYKGEGREILNQNLFRDTHFEMMTLVMSLTGHATGVEITKFNYYITIHILISKGYTFKKFQG